MSPSSKKKNGTREMKSCNLIFDAQKNPTYVFLGLKMHDQPKITQFQGKHFVI